MDVTNREDQDATCKLMDSNENKNHTPTDNIQSIQDGKNVSNNDNDNNVLEINDYDSKCNFMGWSPNWLQFLASKKSYVVIYGILGLNQFALNSYFIGTISTVEKRFKMPSTHTGIIITTWDVGALFTLMFMAYFGSAGHKTRWVAAGALISAISCFIRYLPHSIYGAGVHSINYSTNITSSTENLCNDVSTTNENCLLNSEGMITFLILAGAQFVMGIGGSSYYTLGVAYLDDNSLKNKFPFLLGIVAFIRYFGPTLGYLLASYTLSIYIDSSEKPPFGQDDPRWIGSWHSGWLLFGTTQIIFAVLMAFFPKTLPREAERRKIAGIKDTPKVRSLEDFKQTLIRLMKNPILMYNTFSSTFYIFGLSGYWIFMPKYIETQFRKTASSASLITGTVGLVCASIGIVSSGSLISVFKPRPKYLAAWNIFTEIIDVLGHLSFAFIGCLKDDLYGFENNDGSWNTTAACNIDCNCGTSIKYSPVCSLDQTTTFYSACHAGCTELNTLNGTKIYQNCGCIVGLSHATLGACPIDCDNNFTIFLILLCLMKFLSATGRAGNTIIQFRAVLPDDKSISIALTEVVLCIFTFIPAPIVFGWLLDSSCLVWGMICGKTGNCLLYDGKKLRYLLNFTSSAFLAIAVLLDIGVWRNVGKLKIYDEDVEVISSKTEDETSKSEKPFINLKTFTTALSN